jgi:hypothetical protein
MSPTVASSIATVLAFVVVTAFTGWSVVPWMRQCSAAVAIGACLWVHTLRIVALQIYSARRFGYDIPASMANQIAWGDVVGACLALLALWLLRRRSVAAVPVIWLFVIETTLDFLNAAALAIRHHSARTAHDLSWVILNFYVPVLLISLALATWQLITRRAELLDREGAIR